MTRLALILTMAAVLGFAVSAGSEAQAATAAPVIQPALLDHQGSTIPKAQIRQAGIQLYIGPRYRHRHYRRYRRFHGPRFRLYIGPRHRYRYRHRRLRRYHGRCGYWHRRCVRNWGYANPNYYGCMRYHGCR